MSEDFRRNLLGPEPTLLPAEVEVQARLDAGDEAVDLAAPNPTSSLAGASLTKSECCLAPGAGFFSKKDLNEPRAIPSAPAKNTATMST